ncbi:MAG: hypothetical protein LUD15_07795, partial [Bacteroides sp.]|nr:hypothetical protein [Bacteroides sp.]
SILIYAGMFVFWYRKVIEFTTREATDADFVPLVYFLIIILAVYIVYPFVNALLIKLKKNVNTLYYPPLWFNR